LTGNILSYYGLTPQIQNVQYNLTGTGISIQYDTGTRAGYSAFDLYIQQGLVSGDAVEIYTYPVNNSNIELSIFNNSFPAVNGEAQIYGNGLAETSGVDYTVAFNNLINGFDSNDILLYDIYPVTLTMPYQSGYISTGVSGAGYISITGISGINLNSGFNYDFYLNGQKMISGVNYTSIAATLRVSGNDLSDINNSSQDYLEAKFIPIYSGYLRSLYQISGIQSYISGILGFNPQIWVNGLRQKFDIDYYKYSRCRFCSGNFNDPNYSFNLYSSPGDVGLFSSASDAPVVSYPPGDNSFDGNIQWAYSGPVPNYWILQYYSNNNSSIRITGSYVGTVTGVLGVPFDPDGGGYTYYGVYGSNTSGGLINLTKNSNFILTT
jgi:hypothetical protein